MFRYRKKRIISERTAKVLIYILFTAAVLAFVFFFLNAQVQGATEPPPSASELMEEQQEILAYKEELAQMEKQLEDLEGKLKKRESQLSETKDKLRAARQEKEDILNERVMMIDSVGFEYVGTYNLTAYCCETYAHICGGNGVTASGTTPTPGRTIAADWSLHPAGTWLYIEGVGLRRVEDTGSAIKGQKIDVAIDTHANALRWAGRGNHEVWVLGFDFE